MHKISIILPVKNGEKYISEAVDSVLAQSFKDFELLIFDDASTDGTMKILSAYNDPRIKIFPEIGGFIANLNKGIEISEGKYIARMDADDVMSTNRLETQFRIMEDNDFDVCASWIKIFGEGFDPFTQRNLSGFICNPLQQMIAGNFIAHPTVILRREFLIDHDLWYKDYPYAEDYKLWFDIAKAEGKFYMEPKALLFYRISHQQITRLKKQECINQSVLIQKEIIEYLIGRTPKPFKKNVETLYDQLCKFENAKRINFKSVCTVFFDLYQTN